VPLTKPAVSALSLEMSINNLWQEFLSGLFDGGNHTIGTNASTLFPECEINFQQSPLTQGGSKPEITLTWLSTRELRSKWDEKDGGGVDKRVEDRLVWMLWVRATGGNKVTDCRRVSDLLHGLLTNPAAMVSFGEKGLTGFRASTPRLVPGEGSGASSKKSSYAMRQLSVSASVTYFKGIS